MHDVLLIPCVGPKLPYRARACELYQGPLFAACLAYAERLHPSKTYILSALHGLVDLEQELDPYDVTLRPLPEPYRSQHPNVRVLTDTELDQWAIAVISALQSHHDLELTRFTVLADTNYIEPLRHALRHISEPLAGVSLEDRSAALNKLVEIMPRF